MHTEKEKFKVRSTTVCYGWHDQAYNVVTVAKNMYMYLSNEKLDKHFHHILY